jgi:hypothetical protein
LPLDVGELVCQAVCLCAQAGQLFLDSGALAPNAFEAPLVVLHLLLERRPALLGVKIRGRDYQKYVEENRQGKPSRRTVAQRVHTPCYGTP